MKNVFEGWTTERWASVIVLTAFAFLLAIRYGFRGVNFFGASVTVGT